MSSRTVRRLALLAVACLAASACSVSGSSSSTATTQPSVQAPAASARGVTKTTIKLGAAIIDVAAVKAQYGVDLGALPDSIIPALVKATNDSGGIDGRKVQVVVSKFMPVGSASSQTSCRQLIEDDQVFAVMGTYLDDNALCVTQTHATPYFGSWGLTPDYQARSQAPYLTTAANESDSISGSVQLLVDKHQLKGRKVAVYYESDITPSFLQRYVLDVLKKGHVDVVAQAQLPSSTDAVQSGHDADLILQRFQAAGADTILDASGLPVLMPAIERSAWVPHLVFLNGQIIGAGAATTYGLKTPSKLAGAIGATPGTITQEVVKDPKFQACIKTINRYTNLHITDDDFYSTQQRPDSRNYGQLPGLCQLWDFTKTVLEAAGPNLTTASLRAGLAKLGNFDMQGNPHASLSPTRWGAGTPPRLWTFHTDDVEFRPVDASS